MFEPMCHHNILQDIEHVHFHLYVHENTEQFLLWHVVTQHLLLIIEEDRSNQKVVIHHYHLNPYYFLQFLNLTVDYLLQNNLVC